MVKVDYKKILINFLLVSFIFLSDRVTKIYILDILKENQVDIYINDYLNFYLIWNKGIAFGLFSVDQSFFYNIVTIVITLICIVVIFMISKNEGFKRYSLILILGGALGNLTDRIYYSAVPDFIDLHIDNFHWFIFNVADIFICLGVICLICEELFFNNKVNKKNEKNN